MKTRADKIREQAQAVLQAEQEPGTGGTATIKDNRPSTRYQRKLRETMNASAADRAGSVQRKASNTGLPDRLKAGIENLSGYSMADVQVHYNSGKPAQLQAHAYTRGTDIHLAPGQEKHLPHEAWHVVQQKQDRVKPTLQLKGKVNINDDAGLEKEADVMGAKALESSTTHRDKTVPSGLAKGEASAKVTQRYTGGPVVLGQNYVIDANLQEIQQWLGGQAMWYDLGENIPWAVGGGNAYEFIFNNDLTNDDWDYLTTNRTIIPCETEEPELEVAYFRAEIERGHDLDIIVPNSHLRTLWNIFPLGDPEHQLRCEGYVGGVDFMRGNPDAGRVINGIRCLTPDPPATYRTLGQMGNGAKWWKRGVRANILLWIMNGKPRDVDPRGADYHPWGGGEWG